MKEKELNLIHFYPRYGLSVSLLQAKAKLRDIVGDDLPEILIEATETGLNNFRMETSDDPNVEEILTFASIPYATLKVESGLVQSNGLAPRGKYLYPTIITSEGKASSVFETAENIIKCLRNKKSLGSSFTFLRSFSPVTAKLMHARQDGGKTLSDPKGTLLEGACSIITTLTPNKPAAYILEKHGDEVKGFNTAIIPDLPTIDELSDFIELFQMMQRSRLGGNLMEWRPFRKKSDVSVKNPSKQGVRKSNKSNTKQEFDRPRLHHGNYPFAPTNAAVLGPVGLLAAIGRWAVEEQQTPWAKRVLVSMATRPLYIVSYNGTSQVQFSHHIVGIATNGELSTAISALTSGRTVMDAPTTIYADLGKKTDAGEDLPLYESRVRPFFYLMSSRFLQQFSTPAFRDFLSTRAAYPAAVGAIFEEYFMRAKTIRPEIVHSARALGQWVNTAAYRAAKAEITKDDKRDFLKLDEAQKKEINNRIRQQKAKILVTLDSMAMGAKTPQDLLYRIMRQTGLLMQVDAPQEAACFMDATNSGEIEPEEAVHLLMAYTRLRATPKERQTMPSGTSNYPTEDEDEDDA